MTALSVNLNKIALLRNSRGRDYPNVVAYAQKLIDLGVHGLTVHPRQDERHTTRQDVRDLAALIAPLDSVEFNVEGYPSDDFMALIEEVRPDQCTLVPDGPDQLTSDHGWDMRQHEARVSQLSKQLSAWGVRCSVFLDPDVEQVRLAAKAGVDRIELYTEGFAQAFAAGDYADMLAEYRKSAVLSSELGLGVNAGHDLDLNNLSEFLTVPHILEVSIGHALTVESLEYGHKQVIADYLSICSNSK